MSPNDLKKLRHDNTETETLLRPPTIDHWSGVTALGGRLWRFLIVTGDLHPSHPGRYSPVHISSDEVFSKIPKKPSIVQKLMIPHMNGLLVFIEIMQFFIFFEKKIQNGRLKKRSFSSSANSQYFL